MNPQDDDKNDKVDRLLAAIEEAERQALKVLEENCEAQRQFIWAQQNRLGLLWVHGLMGVLVGLLMLAFGTASNFETMIGGWMRPFLGTLGIVGGIAIIIGLTRRPRSIRWEAIGLALLGVWDLIIMASFTTLLFERPPHLSWPWEVIGDAYSRPYPILIYGGLLMLLLLHLLTLWSLMKLERRGDKK